MLNQTQIQNIINAEKVIFSTADKNGQPRSIWVVPSKVDSDRIILSNIQMKKTFENINENKNCFINVLIPNQDDLQYKIEAVAQIESEGKLFEQIKAFEESENLPPELKVESIIILNLKSIEESNG